VILTVKYRNTMFGITWTGADFGTDAAGRQTAVGLSYAEGKQEAIAMSKQILASLT
jgi:hypothetical protein